MTQERKKGENWYEEVAEGRGLRLGPEPSSVLISNTEVKHSLT